MCGITGIIYKNNKKPTKEEIKRMNDLIIHRGPDDEGYYFGENFAFGHRRLAILDLSEAGHQPMKYKGKNGEYVIVHNGEIYNYIELRNELTKEGYKFKSNTDTEVILASYDKWGTDCLNRFNGMWAFAIYDKEKSIIFCSRDRFGIKPFYYTEVDDKFIFGSEIKQFSVIKGWKGILNKERAFDFLEYGIFDHTKETLFENVFQLRGGQNLIYDLETNHIHISQWYNLKDKKQIINLSFSEAKDRFKSLMYDSIRLRLRSHVKVGSCVSGGLDSSTIVCIVNDILDKSSLQETVSSCFSIKKYDEQEYIDEVTKYTNTKSNKVFPQYSDLFKELKNIIWHQDEPFGSTSIFAQWNVFKEAKKNELTVMLDGQGADELLAGYHSFYGVFLIGLLKRFKFFEFYREVESLKQIHNYRYKYIITMIIAKILKGKLKDYFVNFYKRKRYFFNTRYAKKQHKESFSNVYEFSYEQLLNINLPALLHYEDRDSMAFSIESRLPFLDYRLVEFILNLPDEYKISNGQTKFILRKAMKGIVPEKILNRQDKMGFVTPEEVWLKDNKKFILKKIKETINLSNGFIENDFWKYAENMLENKFDFIIWRVISFGEWLKKFNVKVEN